MGKLGVEDFRLFDLPLVGGGDGKWGWAVWETKLSRAGNAEASSNGLSSVDRASKQLCRRCSPEYFN